ncbi:DsbA family oxidoreductase [Sphingorhabdus sp. Alg239-R122]|uniref:DsbA family oxidoreductase n=1 Tax=Sphingorhabdus sp. Alg239-R122 TaxID=2305989 RepID=UPI0013DADFFB|nr:DsbA family oxidoreductase [Sphingorhabdus sp. Alg239-R122]
MTHKLRIDIVSDVVCPWCIIGYRQLMKALEIVGDQVEPDFFWHPFELNPDMPPEGENSGEHIQRKYGSTVEQSAQARQRIADAGAALGFDFSYTPESRIYNTFKAHLLLSWVGKDMGGAKQTELKLALFAAYFQQGRDVSDSDVLLDVAESIGLDREQAAAKLIDVDHAARVRAEQHFWRERDINGVPAIIFAEKFMVPGAQDAETFAQVIRKVIAAPA